MTTLIPTRIDEVVEGMRERSGEIYGFGETITRSSIDHGFLGGRRNGGRRVNFAPRQNYDFALLSCLAGCWIQLRWIQQRASNGV